LLNRASRFFPIRRELKTELPIEGGLLEVGSGSLGLGEFWNGPFVGCDVTFESRPVKNMRPVRCSGHQLPFQDRSFDAVVVSDVMEHVPPPQRSQIVEEVLRVARKMAVFGYPCGAAAFSLDQELYRNYQSRNLVPPQWLEEHMRYPFPDEELLTELPAGWKRKVIPNENLQFRRWMMNAEMSLLSHYSFRLGLRIAPGFVERLLRQADSEPSYRKIFVLTRELQARG
jgi:hypothetical protein